MGKVITINHADNMITAVADFIESNYLKKGADPGSLAVIFGGRRPSLFLKKELALRSGMSMFSPHFFSMDEFIKYIVEKKETYRQVTELDTCYIIYKLAEKIAPELLKNRETYARFLPWAKEIHSFIEQLDIEASDIKLLENIQKNASIGYDVPDSINDLLKKIISIRDDYHAELKAKYIHSRGTLYFSAAEHVGNASFDEFQSMLFCNCFYLHKTEQKIIKTLYKKDKTVLFFQGSQDEWPVLKELSKELAVNIKQEGVKEPAYALSLYSGSDMHSQVCLAREILKKTKADSSTVIVLPDVEKVIPLLNELAPLVKDYNVSLGYPLRRSSVYDLFEDIFHAQLTRKKAKYYSPAYLKALSNPLVKNIKLLGDSSMTRVIVHKIEELLKGPAENPVSGSLFVEINAVIELNELVDEIMKTLESMGFSVERDRIKTAIRELNEIVFLNWETLENIGQFSDVLDRFLKTLIEKTFLEVYPLNLKVVERIMSISEEMKALAFKNEHILAEDIFRIFKNLLENEVISFSGSPLKGLQVLGLFETRSLGFENVIMLDLNEGVLPKLKIQEPLIPREVMLKLGLNRLEKEEEIQRYHFHSLIASAKNVHLVYEKNDEKARSRFIEDLIWEKQKKDKNIEKYRVRHGSFCVKVMPEGKLRIEKSDEIIRQLKNMTYSASRVDAYLKCPLSFYYRYVLGLSEQEDRLEEPATKDIGIFVHELLAKAYSKFIKRKPIIDESFKKYFHESLTDSFNETLKKRKKSDAFLLERVINFRLDKFLENESARNIKELLLLEKELQLQVKLNGSEYKFKAVIDRLDREEDGSLLVIDYKTGGYGKISVKKEKYESMDLNRESIKKNIKSFQLPIYIHFMEGLYKGEKIDAAFYDLKKGKLIRLFDKKMEYKDNIMEKVMQSLEFILKEIQNPDNCFEANNSDRNACEHCPFGSMCR